MGETKNKEYGCFETTSGLHLRRFRCDTPDPTLDVLHATWKACGFGVRRTSAFRMHHTTARGTHISNPLILSCDDLPDHTMKKDHHDNSFLHTCAIPRTPTQPVRPQFEIMICERNEFIDPSGKTPTVKKTHPHRLPDHEPITHSTTGATHKQTAPMRDPGTCKHTLNRSNPEAQTPGLARERCSPPRRRIHDRPG